MFNYFNWKLFSSLLFKNHQFIWYKRLDLLILKSAHYHGTFNRIWFDTNFKNKLYPLSLDKYNYIFLSPNARESFWDSYTNYWVFYSNFINDNRYVRFVDSSLSPYEKDKVRNYKINYIYTKITKKKYKTLEYWMHFAMKRKNINDLFFTRLHYPFLMLWITTNEINLSENNNLKYLETNGCKFIVSDNFPLGKLNIWIRNNNVYIVNNLNKNDFDNKYKCKIIDIEPTSKGIEIYTNIGIPIYLYINNDLNKQLAIIQDLEIEIGIKSEDICF